jgi:hypothetical protein
VSKYYRRDGTPCDMKEWAEYMRRDRRVAYNELQNGLRVSTVYLGLDHSFDGPAPLIFETMVFPLVGYGDLDCRRYSTEEQAKAGHAEMVEKWKQQEPS